MSLGKGISNVEVAAYFKVDGGFRYLTPTKATHGLLMKNRRRKSKRGGAHEGIRVWGIGD